MQASTLQHAHEPLPLLIVRLKPLLIRIDLLKLLLLPLHQSCTTRPQDPWTHGPSENPR